MNGSARGRGEGVPRRGPSAVECAGWLGRPAETLLGACAQSPYQGPGPGGQKRNRVYSGVRLVHGPSGLAAESSEHREARRNVEAALRRLRLAMALAAVEAAEGGVAGEAFRLAAAGFRVACNPSHADFPRFACAALLAFSARGGRLAESAADLGCTASALTRFLRGDKAVWAAANTMRKHRGLHALKAG